MKKRIWVPFILIYCFWVGEKTAHCLSIPSLSKRLSHVSTGHNLINLINILSVFPCSWVWACNVWIVTCEWKWCVPSLCHLLDKLPATLSFPPTGMLMGRWASINQVTKNNTGTWRAVRWEKPGSFPARECSLPYDYFWTGGEKGFSPRLTTIIWVSFGL